MSTDNVAASTGEPARQEHQLRLVMLAGIAAVRATVADREAEAPLRIRRWPG
jgi:hypothetical protein